MSKFRGDSLSIPKPFADAITRWKRKEFPKALAEARMNLSGRMMRRRTVATLINVETRSKELTFGFRLATNSKSLIAWMEGSQRKGYWVYPKKAKALRWEANGKVFFSRGHFIRPWRFTPVRPVLQDAIDRRSKAMVKTMEEEGIKALRELFPNKAVQMVLKVS